MSRNNIAIWNTTVEVSASHVFFWGGNPLSNWQPATFKHLGFEYNSSEQAMMHRKALLMGDLETADSILKSKIPGEQKALGRQVKNYNEEYWASVRLKEMIEILESKFSQNVDMRFFLTSFGDKVFVEASPYDKIWGIGIGIGDNRIYDESEWRGTNLLGKALTVVANSYKENTSNESD